MAVARAWADSAIFMQAGRVLAAAPANQFFSDAALLTETGLDKVALQ